MHKSVTTKRIVNMVKSNQMRDEYKGICIACGKTAYGVEPDARKYVCEHCEKPAVYGAEELLISCVG